MYVSIASATDVVPLPLFIVTALRAIDVERRETPMIGHGIPTSLAFDGVLGASYCRGHRLVIDFGVGTASMELSQ